jgi:Flp pilus assembly protein TadB
MAVVEQTPAADEEPSAADAEKGAADAGAFRDRKDAAAAPAQAKKRIVMRAAGGKASRRQMPAMAPAAAPAADRRQAGISEKRRTTALLLLLFLGLLGVHRMYVGKIGTGFLFMITGGGLLIWWMVDLALITSGSFRDKQERLVNQW